MLPLRSGQNVQTNIIGWDICGAHVKVAIANKQIISQVQQLVCPLWKGVDELSACVEIVQQNANFEQYVHSITMTGELVDHFVDRKEGVLSIIAEMSNKLGASKVKYYAGDNGFVDTSQATSSTFTFSCA